MTSDFSRISFILWLYENGHIGMVEFERLVAQEAKRDKALKKFLSA
jgi:hypothetical protein